jgi:amino acid transporter
VSPDERRREAEPGGGRALVLAVAGIVLSSALLPWGVLGIALEVAAIVIAVRTLRRAKAAGRVAPGAHAAMVAAGIALAFFVVALAFVGVFYDEWQTYRTCVDRAITSTASDACREQFDHSVRDRLGITP